MIALALPSLRNARWRPAIECSGTVNATYLVSRAADARCLTKDGLREPPNSGDNGETFLFNFRMKPDGCSVSPEKGGVGGSNSRNHPANNGCIRRSSNTGGRDAKATTFFHSSRCGFPRRHGLCGCKRMGCASRTRPASLFPNGCRKSSLCKPVKVSRNTGLA